MRLIFLIFSIFYHISLISQCITGTEPSCRCSTAPVLCNIAELDGYSFSTSGYQHPSDGPFNSISSATSYMCINHDGSLPSNTSSDNPTWFAFIALCDELTIELSYSDCTVENVFFLLGASGLQAAVFSECFDDWDQQSAMPPPYTYSVACDTEYETSFILFTPTSGSRTLNMSGLERGKTYYFLVDGIAGSECGSVDIRVLNDCGIGDITKRSQPIMGPNTI